ncbi:MAG: fumarylacetoacetate hydrolase family protein [Lachnospirales bacterium]
MKLISFNHLGKIRVGAITKSYAYPLPFNSMNHLIEADLDVEDIIAMAGNPIALQEIKIIAPIPVPKQDIICLGVNYMAHAVESARFKKENFGGKSPYAVYFSKRVNECVGDGGETPVYKGLVDSLDYECELAVIIKRDAKNVTRDKAFDYVFGYTILNDISARNLQTNHNQWYFGKSLDGFTPLGPYIVTEDEFSRPPCLNIRSYVNGELRQDSNTSLLIYDIPHVISELSQGMTLKAGTIISMGTPAGVGMGFKPPKWLKKGDVVECEIENIGVLTTYIV